MKELNDLYQQVAKLDHFPGKIAHKELSPLPMKSREIDYSESGNYRIGAVIVLLYLKEKEPFFVLTQRHDYDGAHAGQISLPGGKLEEQDKSTQDTALREMYEEIGISVQDVQIVSALTELYIPPSNFLVYPYLGYVDGELTFQKDDFEVKEVIEVPVKDLLRASIVRKPLLELASKVKYNKVCPCFEFDGKIVWGATAMILNELKHILLK